MASRVAIISIIVENPDSIDQLNSLLHAYSEYVVARMGVPYRQKQMNIISVVVDAPQDTINSLTGALGKLDGVLAKANFSKK